MTNLEKYDKIFVEVFEVSQDELSDLEYQSIETWDSVGHMTLIADIEEVFNITMEMDDIIDLSSYGKGKKILMNHYNIDFY